VNVFHSKPIEPKILVPADMLQNRESDIFTDYRDLAMNQHGIKIGFWQKADQLAQVVRDQCDRRKLWVLCGFTLFYLASTWVLASRKLLWNDELFTFHMARLPDVSELWSALLTGADQIPPLFYLITRASFSLFGVNHLAIRLPEAVGFLIMSLCLFKFVCRRSSALYGFTAMLFPLVTTAYDYAYEARPYGLVLGFSGLALLCWQSAADGRYRKVSLIGLALSCAVALSTHYYGILIFFPLALGEFVRSISQRRVDLAIWLAFGLALAPLLFFIPLIEQARSYSANFWARPHWGLIAEFYYFLLIPAVAPLVAVLILAAGFPTSDPPGNVRTDQQLQPKLLPHETAAALGFIVVPFVAVALAVGVTGAFTHRYALPSVIGFSIVLPLGAARLLNGRAIIGVALVMALCGACAMLSIRGLQNASSVSQKESRAYEFLRSNSEGLWPIVISDAHTFMRLAHYARHDIASRLVYLADPESALRHLGQTTVDRGLLDLKSVFRLNVQPYRSYIDSQERFLVYGPIRDLSWLLFELTAMDMRIELKAETTTVFCF
jgi:hypothetical protein